MYYMGKIFLYYFSYILNVDFRLWTFLSQYIAYPNTLPIPIHWVSLSLFTPKVKAILGWDISVSVSLFGFGRILVHWLIPIHC